MEIAGMIAVGTGLLVCAIKDIKYRQISIQMIIIVSIIFAITGQVIETASFFEQALGAVMGAVFVLVSKVSKGQIGLGDGCLIGALGFYMGIWKSLEALCIALFLCAFLAGFLLLFHRNYRKKRIPFIPFLFLGYLGVIIQ